MADLLADIGGLLGASTTASRSTSRKNNTELNMEDFLQLMIVQLCNQTIDDTMDTSEMMNQMIQMQMITAITNMTEVNVQSYANSLVGKVVTVGIVSNNTLEEREIVVMGTGTYNGQQVIFGHDGNMYYLSQIMAVGRLPDANGNYGVYDDTASSEGSYVDEDGRTIYVGEDGVPGTADDWYIVESEDGEAQKWFVGEDGKAGTEDDYPEYIGEQGAET